MLVRKMVTCMSWKTENKLLVKEEAIQSNTGLLHPTVVLGERGAAKEEEVPLQRQQFPPLLLMKRKDSTVVRSWLLCMRISMKQSPRERGRQCRMPWNTRMSMFWVCEPKRVNTPKSMFRVCMCRMTQMSHAMKYPNVDVLSMRTQKGKYPKVNVSGIHVSHDPNVACHEIPECWCFEYANPKG